MTTQPGTAEPEPASLRDLFRRKAEGVGATVTVVPDEAGAWEALAALAPAPIATRALEARFPRVAARCAPPPGAPAAAADVVTAAPFAVAETGSVAVLEAGPPDRGTCLLAERLWVLVPAAEVEATLDAALARVARLVAAGTRYVTLMTGPSRTADIERVLTTGVHGPREVRLVVVAEQRG